MKLGTIIEAGEHKLVAALGDGAAVTLHEAFACAGLGEAPRSMSALITTGSAGLERLERALAAAASAADIRRLDPERLQWCAPQPSPSKILCVAFNSTALARTLHVAPNVPNFMLKAPSSLTGHLRPIELLEAHGETIPQLEIAVILARRCKHIAASAALDAVFGYAITNGVTAHGIRYQVDSLALTRAEGHIDDWHMAYRHRHGPTDRDLYFTYFARSRASDSFGPMGPWLTTADEVGDPSRITLRGFVDGELFATDRVADYRFAIADVIAEASRYFTLEPGDIITFGTAAKAAGKFPEGHREIDLHRFGDELAIEADGLGRLSNPVSRRYAVDGPG